MLTAKENYEIMNKAIDETGNKLFDELEDQQEVLERLTITMYEDVFAMRNNPEVIRNNLEYINTYLAVSRDLLNLYTARNALCASFRNHCEVRMRSEK